MSVSQLAGEPRLRLNNTVHGFTSIPVLVSPGN
jgi:hypothetical protein